MARYLDPKADLTFKKIFGEHKDLVMSLLNALLPLDDKPIKEIEYLPTELVPAHPLHKNSIVDVRCKDITGRQFIVEMQMEWTTAFKQRVLFNASKAYVRQIETGQEYHLLQPVYSLSLVDAIFEPEMEAFYHSYKLVHEEFTNKVIEGLNLVFVELPKFKARNIREKKMQVLWLRFLTEIGHDTKKVPEEFLETPELKRALDIVEESAYSEAEMATYDKFWDDVSVERTYLYEAKVRYETGLNEGMEKGKAEGRAEGKAEGKAEGIVETNRSIALKMKSLGYSAEDISAITTLPLDEIEKL